VGENFLSKEKVEKKVLFYERYLEEPNFKIFVHCKKCPYTEKIELVIFSLYKGFLSDCNRHSIKLIACLLSLSPKLPGSQNDLFNFYSARICFLKAYHFIQSNHQ